VRFSHFPTKERIFLALVDQLADLLERRVEGVSRVGSHPGADQRMDRVQVALETCLDTFDAPAR
jgi:AcrR family transcriptional regulator